MTEELDAVKKRVDELYPLLQYKHAILSDLCLVLTLFVTKAANILLIFLQLLLLQTYFLKHIQDNYQFPKNCHKKFYSAQSSKTILQKWKKDPLSPVPILIPRSATGYKLLQNPWTYSRRSENDWLQTEAQKVRVESVSNSFIILFHLFFIFSIYIYPL